MPINHFARTMAFNFTQRAIAIVEDKEKISNRNLEFWQAGRRVREEKSPRAESYKLFRQMLDTFQIWILERPPNMETRRNMNKKHVKRFRRARIFWETIGSRWSHRNWMRRWIDSKSSSGFDGFAGRLIVEELLNYSIIVNSSEAF